MGDLSGRHDHSLGTGRCGQPGKSRVQAKGRGILKGGGPGGGPGGRGDAGEARALAHHDSGRAGEGPRKVPPVEGASPGTQGENPRTEEKLAGTPGGTAALPDEAARDLPDRRAGGEADHRGVRATLSAAPPRTAPCDAAKAGRVEGPSRGRAERASGGPVVLPEPFPRRAEDGEPFSVPGVPFGTEARSPRFSAWLTGNGGCEPRLARRRRRRRRERSRSARSWWGPPGRSSLARATGWCRGTIPPGSPRSSPCARRRRNVPNTG